MVHRYFGLSRSRLAQSLVLLLGLTSAAFARAADVASPDSLPSDSTLSLAWVEQTALARNPSLSAMREAWREAGARADQAGALEDPMLEGMLAPRSLGSGSVDPAYRVGLTQQFPIFGQRGLRRRAASSEAKVAAYDFETVRLDLLRDVREAYFDYYRVCRSQETNRELVQLMRESRRVALAKYSAGTVGQTDPLQAETELAMLEHDGVVLRQQRRMILARLRALLHLPQSTALAEPPRDLPLPEAPDTREWLSALVTPRWPELAAADATLVHRERLPGLGLGAAYDRFWSETELRATVGVSLNLPLYFGRLASREREAQAALSKAEAERLAVRDRIEQRIEEASASLGLSLHDVEIMRDAVVPASERSLKAIRAAYEGGRSDSLALLNSTRDLSRARLELYEAQVMAHHAQAELQRALAADAVSPDREDQR
ncbi:MAG: TolC family protein [Candidatus Eisenbacteria bacterium]|uniref:TolC family protein n=1 Tax=Eiseniibacteriota bacterium TaxID=2212470 RepID=A0A538TCT2_UNCEI|nr:MAG: TolC family protein [Candidatus Eisenbacteria bacterium]